jgi:DGQHR domain-containing protein
VPTVEGLKLVLGRELEDDAVVEDETEVLEVSEQGGGHRRFIGFEAIDNVVAEIIDGQHRVEGLKMAIHNAADNSVLRERLNRFDLPLAIMFDLTPEQCAKVFVTINATQRKVDSSHIADLFALHAIRSPQRVCHLVAVAANEIDGSPFKDGLKMLGKRVANTQYLSQGSFTKYLMTLLPKATDSGELTPPKGIAGNSRPFSGLYHNKQDQLIAKIVLDYFKAVSEAYETAWAIDSDNYLIRKTVGFAALMKLLKLLAPALLEHKRYSYADFKALVQTIKSEFPEERWKVGQFSSSDAEAGKIASVLNNIVGKKVSQPLADC